MKRTLVALIAALAAVSSGFPQAVSFTDSRGVVVALPGKANRIVSLSPAITEILFAAGAGPRVVGVTSYCNFPATVASLPKIGAYAPETISVEAIVALKPDLVIGEPQIHKQLAEQFKAAGLRFAALDLTDFADVYSAIETLGLAGGNQVTSTALVSSMKARLEAVRAKVAKVAVASRPLVFWEVWNEPLMTAGPKTFIGMILEAAGARNVFADLSEDWPVVSFEALVARKPDVIMASAMNAAALTPELLAARPGWSSLTAVRERRIVLLDGDIVSRPGPRFVDAVEMVAKALYPALF